MTQSIAAAVLGAWGYDGFKTHTERVSEFYRGKRDVFEDAMRKYLSGLAEWDTPDAGMFFWCVLPPQPRSLLVHRRVLGEGRGRRGWLSRTSESRDLAEQGKQASEP